MSKKSKPVKKAEPKKPRVHKDLQGFEISIDQFGELKSNMNIEKLNEFLDKYFLSVFPVLLTVFLNQPAFF